MEMPKINVPNLVTFLIGHLQFSGVWLGMDLRTNTKKTCTLKKLDYVLKICYPFKAHLSTYWGGVYLVIFGSNAFKLKKCSSNMGDKRIP